AGQSQGKGEFSGSEDVGSHHIENHSRTTPPALGRMPSASTSASISGATLPGCHVLATPLFLPQGWDATNLNAPSIVNLSVL
ncbi:MAG: hypothetical protein ABSC76_14645, partial [Terracidiphilus sp.]